MMKPADQEKIFESIKAHPYGRVKIAVTDIDGVLRGKYISAEKFLSVARGSLGFCDVVFGWDSNDLAYDNGKFTGWHTGYPDAPVTIDLSTLRYIPWENNIPFFLGEFSGTAEQAASYCPRQLLKSIITRAADMGYTPYFSQEFEWFNFRETPQSALEKGYHQLDPLTPGMFGYSVLRTGLENDFFTDLFDLLPRFGIPIEGLHTETGPGAFEAAIQYGPVLESADRAALFKTSVKEIAYKHGIMATFMAKISENLPGCSGHVHQSLWDDKNGKNLFYEAGSAAGMSELMQQYIAGQLYCLPHILPMVAPTINSFKRLVEGAWAPTTLTWGVDNRTVALRALPGGEKSTRLETRVVGSDTNPYLAMAACLAAGLYGIKNKLSLQDATTGNGYLDKKHGILPGDLLTATRQMQASPVANELFGEKFTEHFCLTREWEYRQYAKAVTNWEYKRYFEII